MKKVIEHIEELVGKTIVEANIVENQLGYQELILNCSDGSTMTVGATTKDTYPCYPIEILVDEINTAA